MRGARVTGLDFSANQLAVAPANMASAHVAFPLVRGDAEELRSPTRASTSCSAITAPVGFTDPTRTVPEVARVLTAGGRFVFCGHHAVHLRDLGRWWTGLPVARLERSYFDSRRMIVERGRSFVRVISCPTASGSGCSAQTDS
jgi:ubiquinone/menaquinone biosynthesis C-methylase UbiE